MKHNWTYRKLGEVANIYQPKTLSTEMLIADGKYLVYGANGVIGRYSEYNHKEKELLVTCRGATCGTLNVSVPFSWINGNAMVVHISDNQVLFDFLKYVLKGLDWSLIITGAAQPQITRQNLAPTRIPIPSLDEQQAIVRELDGINHLIDLQEEQLREYDRLAQSLFYTTFGDPVSNPKGWEVKKLGEVAPCVKYSGDIQERKGKYWLLNLDMVESQTGNVIDYLWVDKSEVGGSTTTFNEDYVLYSKLRPYLNKVVLPSHSGYCTTELLPLLPCKDLHKIYLALVLRSKAFVDYIQAKVAGAKMPRVTMNDFKGFNIPLPPLALQQTFAAQVEAIEQQKALVRKSLEETRTLLAARMQYYFE